MLPAENMMLSVGDVDSALITSLLDVERAMTGMETSLTSLLPDGGATVIPSSESASTSDVFGTEVRRAANLALCTAGVRLVCESTGFAAAVRIYDQLPVRKLGKKKWEVCTGATAPLWRHLHRLEMFAIDRRVSLAFKANSTWMCVGCDLHFTFA